MKKLRIMVEEIRVRGRSEKQSIDNDSKRKDLLSPSVWHGVIALFLVHEIGGKFFGFLMD